MFQPGDKVFAKMKGFPFWPARVDPVPDHVEVPKGKLPVFFYGTHQVLVSFEANRDSHGKRKNVAKAMEEIDMDPDVLLLGKDPSADAFWESMYPRSASIGIEKIPEFGASRSVSPVPVKAPKRKPTKAPRISVAKRRRSETKEDDNDSLSSLSEFEDTKPQVTSLNIETLKKGLFSTFEPVSDTTAKASRKKRRQTSKDPSDTSVRSKRSKVSEKAVEIEDKPIGQHESSDASSIDSDVKQIHAQASSDIETSPVELFDEKQSTDEQKRESKPTRPLSPSSFIDQESNYDISDVYIPPKAGQYPESYFRTKRATSSLSDTDEKSIDENLNRTDEVRASPSYDADNGYILKNVDLKSCDCASIKSSDKSGCSEPNYPVPKHSVEIKGHEGSDDALTRYNSENSLYVDVNENKNKPTSNASIDEPHAASNHSTPGNNTPYLDRDYVNLDDVPVKKIGVNRNHRRIRKISECESESSNSSKSSVSGKFSRKGHNDHRVKAAKMEPESGKNKPRMSVERKELQRSGTLPVVDTLQLLRSFVLQLKSSLLRGHENFGAAVGVLERVCATPVTLLQLTEVWELTDCVKKCKKYRPSEEVRVAACKTMSYFQKIQSEASKEEIIKVKTILEERNKARKHQEEEHYKPQESSRTPESKSTTENTPKETTVDGQASSSVTQSPIVNYSPNQPAKRKFSLEDLRAELDEKANSLLARLAATEARLMAERSKKSTSNETTPKNQPSSTIQLIPHRKVEEALSRVDEVASRLTVDLDAASGTDPVPPPPPPPLPVTSQNRLASNRSQNSQPVDLDTRINQLMMGVITSTLASPKPHHHSESSAKLLAIREEIKRKRKAIAQKKQESLEAQQKDKSGDDVIYDLLGV